MDKIALIGIIVNSRENVSKLNDILHEYGDYIIGRMGIPSHEKNVSIISIVMDAPSEVIDSVSKKLDTIPDVKTSTIYS